MNANKNNFQVIMQSNERVLSAFKNKYPCNMSEIIDRNIPKIIITLSIILFAGILTFNIIIGAMSILMGPMLLSFGLKLKKKYREKEENIHKDDKLTAEAIMDINDKLQTIYGDYSDVKDYVDRFKAETRQIDMHKKKLIRRFNTWYTIVIIAISLTFFCMMIVNLTERISFNIPQQTDLFCNILEIKNNEPLLTLTPFDSQIAGGYKIENQNLDFYITDKHFIRTSNIKIDGAAPDEEFILRIVDSNGNSFDRCPQFNFKCTDKTIEAQPRYYKSDFTLLNTFVNLKDNANNLKFKIEKVEK